MVTLSAVSTKLFRTSINASHGNSEGAVLAIVTGIANLGGVMASFVYRTGDAPRYLVGHGVMLGVLCGSYVHVYADSRRHY